MVSLYSRILKFLGDCRQRALVKKQEAFYGKDMAQLYQLRRDIEIERYGRTCSTKERREDYDRAIAELYKFYRPEFYSTN